MQLTFLSNLHVSLRRLWWGRWRLWEGEFSTCKSWCHQGKLPKRVSTFTVQFHLPLQHISAGLYSHITSETAPSRAFLSATEHSYIHGSLSGFSILFHWRMGSKFEYFCQIQLSFW